MGPTRVYWRQGRIPAFPCGAGEETKVQPCSAIAPLLNDPFRGYRAFAVKMAVQGGCWLDVHR